MEIFLKSTKYVYCRIKTQEVLLKNVSCILFSDISSESSDFFPKSVTTVWFILFYDCENPQPSKCPTAPANSLGKTFLLNIIISLFVFIAIFF